MILLEVIVCLVLINFIDQAFGERDQPRGLVVRASDY